MVKAISEAEWDIMRVVWTCGPVTVDQVACEVEDRHDWQLATIKTLLGRLVKKNMLETKRNGRKYIYSAKITEEEATQEMADEFADKICNRQKAAAILELIKQSQLTNDDLNMINSLLAEKKTCSQVKCNCVTDEN
jgi:copper transport repressor, CopY/TcrY family